MHTVDVLDQKSTFCWQCKFIITILNIIVVVVGIQQ